MSPPDFLTDEQMAQLGGGTTNAMPDFIPDEQIAGGGHSFLGDVWQDVKETPRALLDTVTSIPSGVSNVYNSVFNPIDSFNDGTLERTVRSTGKIASGLSGAGAGAIAAAPLAPFTFGASVPIGAALGGAAGMLGFDWLNQATGSDAPTAPEEDFASLRRNTVQGIVTTGAIKGGQAALGKVAEVAPKLANTLDRKSLGARQSDYGTATETRTINTPDDGIATTTKAALDDLLENKKLGTSRDPSTLLEVVNRKSEALSKEVGSLVKAFDEGNSIPVKPKFENALNYIMKGGVPADMVESYVNRLAKIEDNITKEGNGTLSYLQQQKVAFGKNWDAADKVKSGFDRALYSDLQTTIEKHVPDVKPLNAELSKYMTAKPIVKRSLAASENDSPLSGLQKLKYTTGGNSGAALAGFLFGGGPVGAAIGYSLGLTADVLASKTGQAWSAQSIRNVAKAAGLTDDIITKISPSALAAVVQAHASETQGSSSSLLQGTPQSEQEPSISGQGSIPDLPMETQRGRSKALQQKQSELLGPSQNSAPTDDLTQENPYADLLTPSSYEQKSAASELFGEGDMGQEASPRIDHLVKAVIRQESAGNPKAVSNKGASGLMQVMPATAKEIASELGVADYDLHDPETNKLFGTFYLNKMLRMFDGDTELALAAYNAGPGKVRQWVEQYGADWNAISSALQDKGHYLETVNYVPSVLRKMETTQV